MNPYFKKRLKIGLGWVAVFAAIAAGIYLLFFGPVAPTCFDNIKNQNEEGVDCGGACKVCAPEKVLNIISQDFIPTLENNYDLVAKIKNPNNDQGADIIDYEFNIYDGANQLIGVRAGKTYILPQETKYLVEQRYLTEKPIAKIDLKFKNISWKNLFKAEDLGLRVKNIEYQTDNDNNKLVGVIENKSSYDLDTIEVIGILFDASSKIISVGKTSMNTVLRNETRGFEIFWPYQIAGQYGYNDARAYTNVFLNDNFIKAHGELKGEQ